MDKLIGVISSQPKTIVNSKKTFDSIKNQTKQLDIIYWFYPRKSKRFGIDYPEVPKWVSEYKNLSVIRCEDYGPATKIVPLLDMKIHPEAKIVIFDDDSVYPKNNVELLCKNFKKNTGIGFMGSLRTYVPFKNLKDSGPAFKTEGLSFVNRVQIMLCSYMVMYPRSMYPSSSQTYLNDMEKIEGSFLNDDLMNSYYAFKNNIKLYTIHNELLKNYSHQQQEGMLTGTNTPGKYYAKMITKRQAPVPVLYFLILFIVIVVLVYIFKRK